jgi:hypothetical protein
MYTNLMRDINERLPARRSSILLMGIVSNVLPPIKIAQNAGNRFQWAAPRSNRSREAASEASFFPSCTGLPFLLSFCTCLTSSVSSWGATVDTYANRYARMTGRDEGGRPLSHVRLDRKLPT